MKMRLLMLLVVVIKKSNTDLVNYTQCEKYVGSTIRYVNSCPGDAESWKKAEVQKNCESLTNIEKCVDDSKFKYHCLVNNFENATLEVCASIRVLSGYCANFNILQRRVTVNYDIDCTILKPACPRIYKSNETYKFPSCYIIKEKNHNIENSTQSTEYTMLEMPSTSEFMQDKLETRSTYDVVIVLGAVLSILFFIGVSFAGYKFRKKFISVRVKLFSRDDDGREAKPITYVTEDIVDEEEFGECRDDVKNKYHQLVPKEKNNKDKDEEMIEVFRNLILSGEDSPFQCPFFEEWDEESEDEDERESFQQQSGEEGQCKIQSMSANSGKWDGYYIQFNDHHPFSIQLYFGDLDETVKGEGKDNIGDFTINGNWKKSNGSLEFKKQYVGQHDVTYKASIFDDGVKIEGMYKVLGDRGAFFMEKSSS